MPEPLVLASGSPQRQAILEQLGIEFRVVVPDVEEVTKGQPRRLSGRTHEVMSGIALRDGRGERSDVAVTRVRFRLLEKAEIDWYLASGEWAERAGGYAIQGRGAALVEGIEGDYWNVVGLPVPLLLELAPDLLK